MNVQLIQLAKADPEDDITMMLVDNETLITVKGFGTGAYRWKVENSQGRINPEYAPEMTLVDILGPAEEDGMWDSTFLGQAMVWATPVTFAHVVMNIIDNQ